jgi:hypothetical protein
LRASRVAVATNGRDMNQTTHLCAGCGAHARLTRKERGEHGGYFLTFTCLRCCTKEMVRIGGDPPRDEDAAGLPPP